jgi:hypothetical protein
MQDNINDIEDTLTISRPPYKGFRETVNNRTNTEIITYHLVNDYNLSSGQSGPQCGPTRAGYSLITLLQSYSAGELLNQSRTVVGHISVPQSKTRRRALKTIPAKHPW